MKEFDYSLDYKNTLFEPNDPRYRIGREQGVLLIRPYTDDICQYWRFKTSKERVCPLTTYDCTQYIVPKETSVVWDMCRKFLEMGFTRSADTANHKNGRKYDAENNETTGKGLKTRRKQSLRLSFDRCVMKLRMILCISLCEKNGEPVKTKLNK